MIYNLVRQSLYDLEDVPEFCYNNPLNGEGDFEENTTFDFTLEEAVVTKAHMESLFGNNHQYTIKIKGKQMFDMKKDKWFIRTSTPEISEAVQLWLFEQGFGWLDDGQKVLYKSQQFITNTKYPNFACNYLMHSNTVDKQAEENGVKEIKLTFKSSVYSVEYPVVETQAEKELKALEQKIQELTEQASKLRSAIK